jgi:hypothetical protein
VAAQAWRGAEIEALIIKAQETRNVVRTAGTAFDAAALRSAFESQVQAVVKRGLDELRAGLSSGAWRIMESTVTARSIALPPR